MTNTRVALLTGGMALLAAWLSSAAGTVPSVALTDHSLGLDSVPAQAVTPAPTRVDLDEEVARLATRLESAPRPRQSARNPFRLVASPRPTVTSSASVPVAPPAPTALAVVDPVVAVSPVVSLAGIGVERTSYGRRRTAILSADGHVMLGHIGDQIMDRFQVRAITDDAVELFDLRDGTTLSLTLP
jgi:hypothetical protein